MSRNLMFASFLLIVIVLASLLVFCVDYLAQEDGVMPADDLWFCEELGIQLCFIPPESWHVTFNSNETYTYIATDNGPVMCEIMLPIRGRIDLSIFAQDLDYEEILGKVFFHGLCISLDDDSYTIRGDDGIEYRFMKIGAFSAADYLDKQSNQRNSFDESPVDQRYVGSVIDKAVALWAENNISTERIDTDDLCVLFDRVKQYWLVSYCRSQSDTYMALISDSGDYYSVWTQGQED